MTHRSPISPRAGFTLVEALLAAGMMAVLALAVGAIGRDIFSFRTGLTAAFSTEGDARRILRPFADELRAAAYSETGAYPIAETSTSSLTFYADVDRDGVVERARYFLDRGDFKKAVSEPSGGVYGPAATTTLVRGVTASTTAFWYFDEGYDGSASSSVLAFPVAPSEVRAVRIWLTVDADPARAPAAAEITTVATVRNLRWTTED
jgi:hypothetical protein